MGIIHILNCKSTFDVFYFGIDVADSQLDISSLVKLFHVTFVAVCTFALNEYCTVLYPTELVDEW